MLGFPPDGQQLSMTAVTEPLLVDLEVSKGKMTLPSPLAKGKWGFLLCIRIGSLWSLCFLGKGKQKADKNRARVEENFLKLTHVQRQEAAQSRREEKKRAEKERIMNEEDPEKQRRLEVRLPEALAAGLGFSIMWFLCFEIISFPPSLSSLPNLPYINSFPQHSFKFMASFSLLLWLVCVCACLNSINTTLWVRPRLLVCMFPELALWCGVSSCFSSLGRLAPALRVPWLPAGLWLGLGFCEVSPKLLFCFVLFFNYLHAYLYHTVYYDNSL